MSMYCDSSNNSWATVDDLYERYGEEAIDKLATRSNYDSTLKSYVADESTEGRLRVISLALCDSMELIRRKISCKFSNVSLLDSKTFLAVKQWHIKLTIETLKKGGDCSGCECIEDLDAYLDCARICDEQGTCLPSLKTFFSISEASFRCECRGLCKCC